MALFVGKLVLLGGAALVGSVVVEKGRLPTVTESLSGAFKVLRTLSGGESGTSKSKSDNAAVKQEIKNLQHQLQFLDSNRQIVVVSSNGSGGANKYGVIIIVVVVGYGYVWWKGWKLSDMMFATKRGLADACGDVSKRLENVYGAIDKTRRQLNSKIDNVDGKIDECANNTAATKDELSKLRGNVGIMGTDVKSVRESIITLETKLISLEGKQGLTLEGVGELVNTVRKIQTNKRPFEPIEGVSRTTSVPALDNSQVAPARTLSLPPTSPIGPATPSPSNGASQALPRGVEIIELPSQNSGLTSSNASPASESSGFFGMMNKPGMKVVTRRLSSKFSFNT